MGDPDDFRTGHTKVMFRAGKLSNLEEIREGALSVIVNKMQAHVRGCLVAVTFKEKCAEKKAIFSIQNNIRNYYRCKNWPWYQFYMLVVSEAGKIRKKKEEEERRALMAAGFEKLKAAVDEKVAAREAVQKVNEGLKAKIVGLREAHAKEAEVPVPSPTRSRLWTRRRPAPPPPSQTSRGPSSLRGPRSK